MVRGMRDGKWEGLSEFSTKLVNLLSTDRPSMAAGYQFAKLAQQKRESNGRLRYAVTLVLVLNFTFYDPQRTVPGCASCSGPFYTPRTSFKLYLVIGATSEPIV